MLLLSLGCVEYGVNAETRRDSWEQVRRNQAEMLFVVDNSLSMVAEQGHLGDNFNSMLQAMVQADVSWQIAVTTTETLISDYRGRLVGSRDAIVLLRDDDVVLDRVAWDDTWAWAPGLAMQLDGDLVDPQDNDERSSWCAAVSAFDGGYGTPGAWNSTCDGGPVEADDQGEDLGPRVPLKGDVVITELMARSAGLDTECEWFELTNRSADTLYLDKISLVDDGLRVARFAPGATLEPHEVAVVGRSDGSTCGLEVDLIVQGDFSMADGTLLIDSDMPDAEDRFAEAAAVGTGSYGLEMGLEASLLVFQEPYHSEFNASFLDPESTTLTVVIISDEDDMSPMPVATYAKALTQLKGDAGVREEQRVRLIAITGVDAPTEEGGPSCTGQDGDAAYGQRYVAAASMLGGGSYSICGDFSGVLEEIGLTSSGLHTDFTLSGLPNLDTLVVELYASPDDPLPARELLLGEDFTLELRDNGDDHELVLVFPEDAPPPSESALSARYTLLPTGVDAPVTFAEFLPGGQR